MICLRYPQALIATTDMKGHAFLCFAACAATAIIFGGAVALGYLTEALAR